MNVESGTSLAAAAPAFHSDELPQDANYRSLSVLAFVSLLFGLAAPLCFATPLLLVIPLFGAAVSLLALQRIAARDGVLAGRWAATIGLALCVACGAAAISRAQFTRHLRSREAAAFGRDWLALLLSGQSERAFRLTAQANQPEPPPEPGMPVPPTTPYERFLAHPFVRALVGAGAEAGVRYDGTLVYETRPNRQCAVRQRFLVTPIPTTGAESEPHPQAMDAILTLQRSRVPGDGRWRWQVLAYETSAAPADETLSH